MVMAFCDGIALSYANAASAMTRNRKGSAFCANNAAACFVFAMMILSHHSALLLADVAYSVYVSLPKCFTLKGYRILSSLFSRPPLTDGFPVEPVLPDPKDVLVLVCCSEPGPGLLVVRLLAVLALSAAGFTAAIPLI
jgi:hypothetical protein